MEIIDILVIGTAIVVSFFFYLIGRADGYRKGSKDWKEHKAQHDRYMKEIMELILNDPTPTRLPNIKKLTKEYFDKQQ